MTSTTVITVKPALLTVINPSGQRSRAVLNRTPYLMGRQPDNHLVLRDNRVSRIHCRICLENGDYYLEDLQSRHGTYHNGQRIENKVQLFHSDNISFGFPDGYQLIFQNEEQALGRLAGAVTVTTTSTVPGASTTTGTQSLAKLKALVEVARALQGSLSIKEVLESVVDAAMSLTNTDRGFLLLIKDGKLELEVARDRHGKALAVEDLKVPARLIQRALNSRKELLSMHFDPHISGAEEPDVSIAALDLRSVVCIPLVKIKTEISNDTMAAASKDSVGILYLDSKVDLADMSGGSREILQTLALEASTVLENARLLEQERQKHRLDEELRIARGIQRSLLPRRIPSEGWLRAAGSSIASQQVGGDYFDISEVDADWWTLVVADVSGKGVSSALLAALIQGAFQQGPVEPARIQTMIARLNRYIYERTEGEKYATLFYAAIRRDGLVHWTNAGHCTPIRLSRSGVLESLPPTAMPVGMLDVSEFGVNTDQFAAGDKLAIFSDGLTEAQNAEGEYFETARIRRILQQSGQLAAQGVHAAVLSAVEAFAGDQPQNDDMTLVVAEYNPASW